MKGAAAGERKRMVRYTAGAKGITVTRWEGGRPAKISREKMVNPNPEATSCSTPASVGEVGGEPAPGGGEAVVETSRGLVSCRPVEGRKG